MLGYDLGKAGWDLYQVIKTGSSDIAKAIATVIPGLGLTDSFKALNSSRLTNKGFENCPAYINYQ
jgi:hypothetical protein